MELPSPSQRTGGLPGWAIVILICAAIIGWGLLIYALVADRPRHFDYNVLPDAPSESIYSTEENPREKTVPKQTPPLPEAQPWTSAGPEPSPSTAPPPPRSRP